MPCDILMQYACLAEFAVSLSTDVERSKELAKHSGERGSVGSGRLFLEERNNCANAVGWSLARFPEE